MAVGRIKVYKERKRLSPWLWLLPLLLLIALAAILFKRHQAQARLAASHIATSTLDTLPDLGTVQFEPNQPTLTEDGQATLDRASEAMHGNPNVRLRLEGYADTPNSPKTAPRNPSLAQRRTQAVARYLESKGLDHTRLSGGRFTHPIPIDTPIPTTSPSDTRRVELYALGFL